MVLNSTDVVSASELVRVPFRVQMLLPSQPDNLALVTVAIGNKDKSGLVPKAVELAVSEFTISAFVNPPSRNFSLNKLGKDVELKAALVVNSER